MESEGWKNYGYRTPRQAGVLRKWEKNPSLPTQEGAQALKLRPRDVTGPPFRKTPAGGRTVLSGYKP